MPLVGLLELSLQLFFSKRAPGPEQWVGLRSEVEREAADRPLIVVAPAWAEPNARAAFGNELMPLAHVARADESGFGEALEVSILGASAPELTGWLLGAEEHLGPFRLRRYRNPSPQPVLYDFVEHIEPSAADVRTGAPEQAKPCTFTSKARVSNGDLHGHPTFPRRRFACPGEGDWFFVGVTVIEDQQYRPRRCIWAHPSGAGPLRVRFEAVPVGSRLRGYAGLPYWFEREERGSPVQLTVSVAGEVLGDWQHADGEGWKPFEFSTERFRGQTAPVEFAISTARAWRREFCFQADVR